MTLSNRENGLYAKLLETVDGLVFDKEFKMDKVFYIKHNMPNPPYDTGVKIKLGKKFADDCRTGSIPDVIPYIFSESIGGNTNKDSANCCHYIKRR